MSLLNDCVEMEERGSNAVPFRITHPKGIIHLFRGVSMYKSY